MIHTLGLDLLRPLFHPKQFRSAPASSSCHTLIVNKNTASTTLAWTSGGDTSRRPPIGSAANLQFDDVLGQSGAYYVCMCMYIHTYTYIRVYIYIYTYRERERERHKL